MSKLPARLLLEPVALSVFGVSVFGLLHDGYRITLSPAMSAIISAERAALAHLYELLGVVVDFPAWVLEACWLQGLGFALVAGGFAISDRIGGAWLGVVVAIGVVLGVGVTVIVLWSGTASTIEAGPLDVVSQGLVMAALALVAFRLPSRWRSGLWFVGTRLLAVHCIGLILVVLNHFLLRGGGYSA